MISIYSFYILMVAVEMSNSLKNYAVIYRSDKDLNDPTNKPDDKYSAYWNSYNQYGQEQLDPVDFFVSLYNPYEYFLSLISNSKNEVFKNVKETFKNIEKMNADTTQSYSVNNITCLYAVNSLLKVYDMDDERYIPDNIIGSDQAKKFIYDKKDVPPFNEILKNDYFITKVLSSYFPKITFTKSKENGDQHDRDHYNEPNYEKSEINETSSDLSISEESVNDYLKRHTDIDLSISEESVNDYLKRHTDIVKLYLGFNKNVFDFIQKNPIKRMSKDRVKNLKLPNLLRFESYNMYVLRMKNMGIVPFSLNFLQDNYNIVLDEKHRTIFDELELKD